jgi:hypothetical protein
MAGNPGGRADAVRAGAGNTAYVLVCLLVVTVPWNGIRFGGGGVADLIFVAAFAFALADWIGRRRPIAFPAWLAIAGTGMLLAATIDQLLPSNHTLLAKTLVHAASLNQNAGISFFIATPSSSTAVIKFELSLVLVPVLLATVCDTPSRCRRMLDLWTFSLAINAAVGLLDLAGIATIGSTPTVGNRASGLTIQPNYLALACNIGIPLALVWIGRSRRWTAAAVIVVPLLLGGVYASGSRDGAAASVIAIALTVLAVPRLRRLVGPALLVFGIAGIVVLAYTSLGKSILNQVRIAPTSSTAISGSDFARGYAASVGWSDFTGRPVAGVGFAVIDEAHDIYLQLLAAGGIIALASFLVFCGGLLGAAREGLRGRHFRDETIAASIAVIVWLANGAFDNQVADKYLYVVPGLLLALARVARSERWADEHRTPLQSIPVWAPQDSVAVGDA